MQLTEDTKQKLIHKMIIRLPQIRKEMKISQTEFGKIGLRRQTILGIGIPI